MTIYTTRCDAYTHFTIGYEMLNVHTHAYTFWEQEEQQQRRVSDRNTFEQHVTGSDRRVGSVVRALDCRFKGRGFESRQENNKNSFHFFQRVVFPGQKCRAGSLSVCPTPVCKPCFVKALFCDEHSDERSVYSTSSTELKRVNMLKWIVVREK